MSFESGLFLNKIPYIKSGSGLKTMVFFYGGSAIIKSLEKSSARNHLGIIKACVPEGYTYYIFGYEQCPERAYGINQIADDFAKIISNEIGRAAIVGLSFGGFVALRFAARYPELTKQLILLISAHNFSARGQRKIDDMMYLARNECFYDLVKEFSLLFRRPWLNIMAGFMLWLNKKKILRGLNPGPAIINSLEGIFSQDICENMDFLDAITTQTLVIGGTEDQFFGVEEFKRTAECIKDATLRLFEQETHMLPVERRKDVAKAVKDFVLGRS